MTLEHIGLSFDGVLNLVVNNHNRSQIPSYISTTSKQASLFFPKYLYINIRNEHNIRAGCQKGHRPIKLAT